MTDLQWPTKYEIADELIAIQRDVFDDSDLDYIDVRLQVLADGTWFVHCGDPCYDTDHRGYWGASSITRDRRIGEVDDIAQDLLDDVQDMHAQDCEE